MGSVAVSTLNQFRSRERVFAAASVRNEKSTDIQETEVAVKKINNKVYVGAASSNSAPPWDPLARSSLPSVTRITPPTTTFSR